MDESRSDFADEIPEAWDSTEDELGEGEPGSFLEERHDVFVFEEDEEEFAAVVAEPTTLVGTGAEESIEYRDPTLDPVEADLETIGAETAASAAGVGVGPEKDLRARRLRRLLLLGSVGAAAVLLLSLGLIALRGLSSEGPAPERVASAREAPRPAGGPGSQTPPDAEAADVDPEPLVASTGEEPDRPPGSESATVSTTPLVTASTGETPATGSATPTPAPPRPATTGSTAVAGTTALPRSPVPPPPPATGTPATGPDPVPPAFDPGVEIRGLGDPSNATDATSLATVSGTEPPRIGNDFVLLRAGNVLVQLKNGNFFTGVIYRLNAERVLLRVTEGEVVLAMSLVEKIMPLQATEGEGLDKFPDGYVELRNRNRIWGKILQDGEESVVLALHLAKITIPREEVTAVVQRAPTVIQIEE